VFGQEIATEGVLMRRLLRLLFMVCVIGPAGCLVFREDGLRAESPAASPEPKIEVVKYGKLAEVVRGYRGKVIVVDVWSVD
jgi:hypothetical protein